MSFTAVRNIVGATALLAASFSSQASLIVNGDFEMNPVNPGNWAVFNSNHVAGWQGSNIEIWNAMNGVLAVSGDNFIELNAHGANSGKWYIFQDFATEIGKAYQLSFFYRARNNNERFDISVAGLSQTLSDHNNLGWTLFSSVFVATDSLSRLGFTSQNASTTGNFIDNVQVSALPSPAVAVPEPVSLAAFGLGLLALVGGRRLGRNK
ncbi:hypothetical protein WG68_12725 [Arsukibacterium ikkense]|uniref:DUF642 domain-containing protein n=1 Tax=Arsukibacterium ikkense TaxID=336831 RepID=A0A0M2V761_9GAMM|nr:DUF642 domain-containing protein [Arsukibacterium ikkense]KKO44998.1 hypothetical protein WG68_12725 [Arsukibacterium ikkense]